MTQLEQFTKKLRELAAEAPPTILTLPPNAVGLPEGAFIPENLLNYIANCMDGKTCET